MAPSTLMGNGFLASAERFFNGARRFHVSPICLKILNRRTRQFTATSR